MPISRKKACSGCRQAKARCDLSVPECTRCRSRGVRCTYDDGLRFSPFLNRPQVGISSDSSPFAWSAETNELDFLNDFDNSLCELDETMGSWPMAQDAASSFNTSSSSAESAELDKNMRKTPYTNLVQEQVQGQGEDRGGLAVDESVNRTDNNACAAVRQTDDRRVVLTRRQILRQCMLTNVILGQLTGFPKMMIEGDQLPPFIHPRCYTVEQLAPDCIEQDAHQCLPRHLAICAGLVRMYYTRTAENSDFVWNSIYQEQRRIGSEYPNYNTNEQLEALQSVVIYLLLQADDSDTAERNGVTAMIQTISEISSTLSQSQVLGVKLSAFRHDRHGWILQESIQRIMLILGICELLLNGIREETSTASSQRDWDMLYSLALPCPKQLWAARTNRAWRSAFDRHVGEHRSSRPLTVGDLLNYDTQYKSGQLDTAVEQDAVLFDVIKWCENLDQLGTLLWMAAPFEKWRRQDDLTW